MSGQIKKRGVNAQHVHPVDASHDRKRPLSSVCRIDLNQAQDNARRPSRSGFAGGYGRRAVRADMGRRRPDELTPDKPDGSYCKGDRQREAADSTSGALQVMSRLEEDWSSRWSFRSAAFWIRTAAHLGSSVV
jgi:hypothetical protein